MSFIRYRSLASNNIIPLIHPIFAGTLFLSALLLFSLQPMYAKLILPKLGGSPSVWAIAMCFFQGVLLAGYGYAYALTRWLSGRSSVALHLLLLLATSFTLPFGIPQDFPEPVQVGADIWLLELLFVGVGLPFFAVSATAPLLQHWFSRTDNHRASDPYFLYAFSNLGSMIALLTYPIVLEPQIGLNAQSRLWFAGFILLALMVALCGMLSLYKADERENVLIGTKTSNESQSEKIGWSDRLIWVALAFVPSGLVIAVTTYITSDIASAPFLWVMPLALFLTTFVLVFREHMPFRYELACAMLPVAILGTVSSVILASTQLRLITIVFAVVAFFLAAIVCHRELYIRRPGAARLTEFYFWMSFGGVLGGIFAALIAPHVFVTTFEFPLLILISLLCRPGLLLGREQPLKWHRIGVIALVSAVVIGAYMLATGLELISHSYAYLILPVGVVCSGLLLIRKWPEHDPALVLVMIVAAALAQADHRVVHAERSFFGAHKVMETDDGAYRYLVHGTTIHGAQRLLDAAGKQILMPAPATYYNAAGPIARGIAVARTSLAEAGRDFNVGIVGLGAGSLACYAQGSEHWRHFEIDPAVVQIATQPRYFSFLSRCTSSPDIVIGDARLTVARERAASFGYLVIDAFSSDTIPIHLLTSEALQIFIDKLDPDGIVAIHISNRHLDLESSLASTLAGFPGVFAVLVNDLRSSGDLAILPSTVVFVSRKKSVLAPISSWSDARELASHGVRSWSDDYSDVFGALIRRLTNG